MPTESKQKNINEEDILMSLDNAIKAYKVKDFETITKSSLSKTKGVKRAKTNSAKNYKDKRLFQKVEQKQEATIIKRKSKRKMGFIKRNRLALISFFGNISRFIYKYNRQFLTGTLVLIMLGFVSYSSYIAYAYMTGVNDDVLTKVGRHVVLPVGETPKVYIVQSDKSEIFQNPLFKGIAIGDNVLSYTNAGKVIIYRAKEDKVVNIVNTSQ